MQSLSQDLGLAVRQLRLHPRFAAVAVLTLALGIGANTAIFSALNRLILHPLPYAHSQRLVFLMLGVPNSRIAFPAPRSVARAWRKRARSLAGVEAYTFPRDGLASGDGGTRLLHYAAVTPGLPAFLGVRPVLGRVFTRSDADPGAPAVALLSAGLWQRDYGGGNVIGRRLTVDGVSRTIVGVMPRRWAAFSGPTNAIDLWVPLSLTPAPAGATDGSGPVQVIARLRPDVDTAGARSELHAIAEHVWTQNAPPAFAARILSPSQLLVRRRTRETLPVLFAAVALLLLVACANVANLLLARAAARSPELALRVVLGAQRRRLIRQLMTESLLLAVIAGALGAGLGWAGLHVIARLRPDLAALRGAVPDASVLAFTLTASVATGVLFGLVPAIQLSASSPAKWLRHHRPGALRQSSGRLRRSLVAGEIAVCVVLLVSAGLLVRSVLYLEHEGLGFDARRLFAVQLTLPRSPYQNAADSAAFTRQLLARIRAMPGTAGAVQAMNAPPRITVQVGAKLELRGGASTGNDAPSNFLINYVQPDYFRVLRMRIVAGRTFSAEEMHDNRTAIVNRAMARRLWGNRRAVGQQFRLGPKSPWVTVAGVVADAVAGPMTRGKHTPEVFWPYTPAKGPPARFATQPTLIVRSKSDPSPVIAAIRRAAKTLAPRTELSSVTLTETALAASLAAPRFDMTLLTAFAVVALVLASVGIAAVVQQAVNERRHEIGIRMALGAAEKKILQMVLKDGALVCAAGLLIGVVATLPTAGLLTNMIYGVAPRDPLTFLCVVTLLAAVVLVFTWLPARRATRVDPVIALRAE